MKRKKSCKFVEKAKEEKKNEFGMCEWMNTPAFVLYCENEIIPF